MSPNATITPIRTRRPTGKPPWPIMLIAGGEKTGKSWACAQASASQLIGRTFWIGAGEDDPDEYGALPDADFEIVIHDGSYKGILMAARQAAAEPAVDGKPNLIVFDSGTRTWDLLSGMAQAEANARKAKRSSRPGGNQSDDEARITVDLWNVAKDRWQAILDVLREHSGPSIITARLEQATVMDDRGEPTKEKIQKVKAEKNLPFDVGVIVEMPKRDETWLTGVRSVRYQSTGDRTRYADFTVEKLWTDLGLAVANATSERHYTVPVSDLGPAHALLAEILELTARAAVAPAAIAKDWAASHEGQAIQDATDVGGLELLRDDLAERARLAGELAQRRAAVA